MVYLQSHEFFGGPLNGHIYTACNTNHIHFTYDGDYRINWLYREDADGDMVLHKVTAEDWWSIPFNLGQEVYRI